MKSIPIFRLIVLSLLCIVLYVVGPSIEPALLDDVAVASLNDPTANRSMIIYEDNKNIVNIASYVLLGLVGTWTLMGFSSENESE